MARRKRIPFLRTLGVAGAVILFWRGAWGLMDLYIFPDNQPLSFLVSVIAGLIVLGVLGVSEDELV